MKLRIKKTKQNTHKKKNENKQTDISFLLQMHGELIVLIVKSTDLPRRNGLANYPALFITVQIFPTHLRKNGYIYYYIYNLMQFFCNELQRFISNVSQIMYLF